MMPIKVMKYVIEGSNGKSSGTITASENVKDFVITRKILKDEGYYVDGEISAIITAFRLWKVSE